MKFISWKVKKLLLCFFRQSFGIEIVFFKKKVFLANDFNQRQPDFWIGCLCDRKMFCLVLARNSKKYSLGSLGEKKRERKNKKSFKAKIFFFESSWIFFSKLLKLAFMWKLQYFLNDSSQPGSKWKLRAFPNDARIKLSSYLDDFLISKKYFLKLSKKIMNICKKIFIL